MAIARIASQDATGTGTTSATATYPATPTSGNLLIALTGDTDGAGSIPGWTKVLTTSQSASSNITFYYKVAGSGEAAGITATDVGAASFYIAVFEYTGFNGTPTLDQSAQGGVAASTTSPSGTTAITQSAQEVAIAGFFFSAGGFVLSSYSNSFNARATVNGALFVADKLTVAAAAQSTTLTTTAAGTSGGAIYTFRDVINNRTSNMGKYVSVGSGMSRSEVAN